MIQKGSSLKGTHCVDVAAAWQNRGHTCARPARLAAPACGRAYRTVAPARHRLGRVHREHSIPVVPERPFMSHAGQTPGLRAASAALATPAPPQNNNHMPPGSRPTAGADGRGWVAARGLAPSAFGAERADSRQRPVRRKRGSRAGGDVWRLGWGFACIAVSRDPFGKALCRARRARPCVQPASAGIQGCCACGAIPYTVWYDLGAARLSEPCEDFLTLTDWFHKQWPPPACHTRPDHWAAPPCARAAQCQRPQSAAPALSFGLPGASTRARTPRYGVTSHSAPRSLPPALFAQLISFHGWDQR